MKISILKTAIVIFLAAVGSAAYATETFEPVGKELQKNVVEIIGNPDLTFVPMEDDQLKATLHFVVNDNNEIVVLQVDTESKFADEYLKSKLNYKKIDVQVQSKGAYEMKIVFKSENRF